MNFKLILTGDEKGFDPAQHVPQMLEQIVAGAKARADMKLHLVFV